MAIINFSHVVISLDLPQHEMAHFFSSGYEKLFQIPAIGRMLSYYFIVLSYFHIQGDDNCWVSVPLFF